MASGTTDRPDESPRRPARSLESAEPTQGSSGRLAERLAVRGAVGVVHCQSEFTVGALGKRVARRLGVPLVITAHSNLARQFAHWRRRREPGGSSGLPESTT
ncbi:glycosyltransferase [Streptomyces gamaensis]|uniref:Glycosyltransferase n=1 Tax=Streptomyces gamaensis TaxID=1763542 RepID=A0ABW0YZB4_9ACTN